ncbi:hypothetical protein Ga0609869_000583 [Rhodovulum iodosum]|uniref:Secreted protein n=1 Tax=Rhodovulum iodosum TaxID=68291 RepID=A0ABV3XPI6_9RHOB|nr:hypothetical protein [Rhodovulum robiginosum]RSK31477.1 hypothetical protein EJA01_15175 [Rhodovulum robiginosum]
MIVSRHALAGALSLLCAGPALAVDTIPHDPNSIPAPSYSGAVACPAGLHPVQTCCGVACDGPAPGRYYVVDGLDQVPADYSGRVYVLTPYDSGYQDLGW